jgi:hypothetical protein
VADGDIVDRINKGSFSFPQFRTLMSIIDSIGDSPLAVRSSGMKDSRGTGTYKTTFSKNEPSSVKRAIRKVLSSYFTPSAVAFRRDAETGDGFGIIIEPLIGQSLDKYDDDAHAPMISGFGYTSTSRGDGYIVFVPGLGGGVDTRNGHRITKKALLPFSGRLMDYRDEIHRALYSPYSSSIGVSKSAFLQTDQNMPEFGRYNAAYFDVPTSEVYNGSIAYKWDLLGELDDLNMIPLFQMMEDMEKRFAGPQYFEWALTIEDGKPRWWIAQIADIDLKLDSMDFDVNMKPIAEAHSVIGTGDTVCNDVVHCWNQDDIRDLSQYNQEHSGYVLVYPSRLTTLMARGYIRTLSYYDVSNAAVLIEIQDAKHSSDPIAHFGGQLDMTKKFFGVVNYKGDVRPKWDNMPSRTRHLGELRIIEGAFRVISSEKQNRLVIYDVEQS